MNWREITLQRESATSPSAMTAQADANGLSVCSNGFGRTGIVRRTVTSNSVQN